MARCAVKFENDNDYDRLKDKDRKCVEALDRMLKRFTKLLPGLEFGISYKERLGKLGFFCLRGDQMEVYKNYMRNLDWVAGQIIFPRVEITNTRRHKVKGERENI